MASLIDELKAEHAKIFDTLLRVKLLGVESADGRQKLIAARDLLLKHLAREDESLYPVLHEAAKKDEDLRGKLDLLALDMKEVTRAAVRFFEKYAGGPQAAPKTAADTGKRGRKGLMGLFASKSGAIDDDAPPEPSGFAADFEELQHLLLTRIQKEERILYKAFLELGD